MPQLFCAVVWTGLITGFLQLADPHHRAAGGAVSADAVGDPVAGLDRGMHLVDVDRVVGIRQKIDIDSIAGCRLVRTDRESRIVVHAHFAPV